MNVVTAHDCTYTDVLGNEHKLTCDSVEEINAFNAGCLALDGVLERYRHQGKQTPDSTGVYFRRELASGGQVVLSCNRNVQPTSHENINALLSVIRDLIDNSSMPF